MTAYEMPPLIDGCGVLPPMEPTPESVPTPEQEKPKRIPDNQRSDDRFADLCVFIDSTAGELTRSDLLVWLAIFSVAGIGTAAVSHADIARRVKLSSRTVGTAARRLEKRGLLKIVYRGGLNRGPSRYRVNTEPKR